MATALIPLRRTNVLSIVAVLLLGFTLWLIFSRSISSPFLFDDSISITGNSSIVQLWPLIGNASHPGPLNPTNDLPTAGRPLVNYTLALNYYFGGLNPVGYHLFNLTVHLLAALLLMLIVNRILQLDCFGVSSFDQVSGLLAFLAATLWAVHPLQTETVVYVTQRTELIGRFLLLATIYCSLRFWSSVTITSQNCWIMLATLSCLAGMACKEVMATVPVVVLLFDRTFISGSFRNAWRRSQPLYLGLSLGWLLLIWLNYHQPRSLSGLLFGATCTSLVVHASPSVLDIFEAGHLAMATDHSLSIALSVHRGCMALGFGLRGICRDYDMAPPSTPSDRFCRSVGFVNTITDAGSANPYGNCCRTADVLAFGGHCGVGGRSSLSIDFYIRQPHLVDGPIGLNLSLVDIIHCGGIASLGCSLKL